ncbi:MAG: group III truncated hemoglobin [Nitrospinaceae bacterium]|jgi:hemoglobin|nr:group III truncated hemoglobin [Nitrospina sp.]MBT5869244.1 group III truncated hemoglobin [Nitrospinaceae bacterium]
MNNSANTENASRDDIQSGKGIQLMVDSFYGNARQDELLGPIFERAISDWQHHLPTMYQFWERLLFGHSDYAGNPFSKHLPLSLEAAHFTRWLQIFIQTIDENFIGLKADEVKRLAKNIAGSFQLRMGITPESQDFEVIKYSRG